MATNPYFSQSVSSEQGLYEDIVIESLKMFGQDVYYLPRTIVNEDTIFGDDVPSKFSSSHKVEMYIENVEGFDGEGDLFTKFGVEIRDQATFIIARKRWGDLQRNSSSVSSIRPNEGDLIYLPLTNKLFQVMHVEHEQPFYALSNLPTYKMRCELFEYSDEDLDTGIDAIQEIEENYAYTYSLTLDSALTAGSWSVGDNVKQTLADGTIMSGEVSAYSDSDKIVHLVHVGANDGAFHNFATNRSLITADSSGQALVTAIAEVNKLSANEQNDDFNTTATDMSFLDFSETNPFGDPR